MPRLRLLGQIFTYALIGLALVSLSRAPAYRPLEPGRALLRVALSHPGARLGECRERTAEELVRMAPNLRAPLECPRERAPVRLRLELDGAPLIDETLAPGGLARDGMSTLYRRFEIGAGRHRLRVRVAERPDAPSERFDRSLEVDLDSGQVLTVSLNAGRLEIL
jgi:hypothetical protein